MLGRLIAAVILVVFGLSSCVTMVPMRDGDPVEVNSRTFENHYYQEGDRLDYTTMPDVLEDYEGTEEDLERYERRNAGYRITNGVASAFFLGATLATVLTDDLLLWSSFFGTGLTWLIVSLPFSSAQHASLEDAVEIYNSQLPVTEQKAQ
jgi:hypothetical protein